MIGIFINLAYIKERAYLLYQEGEREYISKEIEEK